MQGDLVKETVPGLSFQRCAGEPSGGHAFQDRGQREDKAGPGEHTQGERPGGRDGQGIEVPQRPHRASSVLREHGLSAGWGGLELGSAGLTLMLAAVWRLGEAGGEREGCCRCKGVAYALGVARGGRWQMLSRGARACRS